MLYVKEKGLLICISENCSIISWNLHTNQIQNRIEKIDENHHGMYQLDNERIIIGGTDGMIIINIDKCIIEDKFTDENHYDIFSFLKLRDINTILMGYDYGCFCAYDLKEKKCSYIESLGNFSSSKTIVSIDESTFVSCLDNEEIVFWKY